MKKISLVFAVLFCTIVSGFSSDGKNSCVNCHSRITKVDSSRPAHSFVDWENSIHAKRGIACDACHGGNSAAPEADKAHEKISKSSDPESSIYFNKIPDSFWQRSQLCDLPRVHGVPCDGAA
ncbi:MAG: hypothetical protein HYY63_05800 [Elusimicrobia bacterium]|nr:hypothetical protein [Elusimicrobiota bacterium]